MFLGIIIVVLFVLFAFTCYKKAPPTAAIVVTGFELMSKPLRRVSRQKKVYRSGLILL